MTPLIGAIAIVGTVRCGFVSFADAADCSAIAADYDAALPAAQACDPNTPDSCAASRPRSLRDVCRCEVAVNPNATAELDQLPHSSKDSLVRTTAPSATWRVLSRSIHALLVPTHRVARDTRSVTR